MAKQLKSDFCIEIDFEKGSENPQRVFKAMQDLINVFSETDKTLIKSIDSKIEPVLILEDIEIGSLRSWFGQLFREVDDDALKNLDWKPQVGKYLVKAKYAIINFVDGKSTITDRKQISGLQDEIYRLAEETNANNFPSYAKPDTMELLKNIQHMSNALDNLNNKDKARFISSEGKVPFNLEFEFSPESIEDLLTKQTISNTITTILKVKKPDYLGESMWEFRYEGESISAKILHLGWLKEFQERKVDIRPGDSLKAKLKIDAKFGYENDHIATKYEVLKVINVEQADKPNRGLFDGYYILILSLPFGSYSKALFSSILSN